MAKAIERAAREASIPPHIRARIKARAAIGQDSELAKAIKSGSVLARLGDGLVESDEHGNLLPRSDLMGKNQGMANELRSLDREQDAKTLRDKYPSQWGKRGQAGMIARIEKISIRTVQKYFKDFP